MFEQSPWRLNYADSVRFCRGTGGEIVSSFFGNDGVKEHWLFSILI